MADEYRTRGGDTRYTTQFEDIPLEPTKPSETTRKVLLVEAVDNKHDSTQALKATILHQRKGRGRWEDAPAFSLAHLKAGEEVRLSLDCAETHHLLRALTHLYEATDTGRPTGEHVYRVVDTSRAMIVEGSAREVLLDCLESEGDNFWEAIDELHPGLLDALSLRRQHQHRTMALSRFRQMLDSPEEPEPQWQKFFEANLWIFGHGLDYRFLHTLQAQADYGGSQLDGRGEQRGDFLMATKAQVGFTVLVEIKTPATALLGRKLYRNQAWEIGSELANGVAQVQAQCAQWAAEGSRQQDNYERLSEAGIYTCQPQGILVIGNTDQLDGNRAKRETFERFRRNLLNPQILTFDELYERAKFVVEQMADQTSSD
jgi:hypothetical protein